MGALLKIIAFSFVMVATGGFLAFAGYVLAFCQKSSVITFCAGLVLMLFGVVLCVAVFAGLSGVRFIV